MDLTVFSNSDALLGTKNWPRCGVDGRPAAWLRDRFMAVECSTGLRHDLGDAVSSDRADLIRANLRIVSVPGLPTIRLYAAHPGSRLRRLAEAADRPPYWAYVWAGGAALARYVTAHPLAVAGRRVFDLGAGSGVVAIAAASAGAAHVIASEIDANGIAAIGLNGALNRVTVALQGGDRLGDPPPAVDVVLAGDVFYDAALAVRVTAFLDRCVDAGIEVLVGDPGRAPLPHARLTPLAAYPAADFADGSPRRAATVYAFGRPRR